MFLPCTQERASSLCFRVKKDGEQGSGEYEAGANPGRGWRCSSLCHYCQNSPWPEEKGASVMLLVETKTSARISRQVKKVTLVNPNEKYPLKLVEKIILSHDTRLFRHAFDLPWKNPMSQSETGKLNEDFQIWASFSFPLPWSSHWTAHLPLS